MSSTAKKIYQGGDRVVLYLPNDVHELVLKFINSQRKVSPAIIEIIEQKSKKIYGDFDNIMDKQGEKACDADV